MTDNDDSRESAWTAGLGRRIETVLKWLGKDASVAATRKSWIQLSRYKKGADMPVIVLWRLSEETGVSMTWLCEGVMTTARDAEMEIVVVESELDQVNKELILGESVDRFASVDRQGAKIQELAKLRAIMSKLEGRQLRETSNYRWVSILDFSLPDEDGRAGPRGYAEVDIALLQDLMVALDEVLLELNRKVSFETTAKLIGSVYRKAIDAREDGVIPGLLADMIKLVRRSG